MKTNEAVLPAINGARFVSRNEARDSYNGLGFQLPSSEVRCHVPGDKGPGAVFTWASKGWKIESGWLDGKALRAWNRLEKAGKLVSA